MLLSMTGFGAAHRSDGYRVLSVEARSVNHRYCDVRFSVPRDLEALTLDLEEAVRRRIRRGRVDIAMAVTFAPESSVEPNVDIPRAEAYWAAYRRLAEALGRPAEISLTTIAQAPGVFRAPEARVDAEEDLKMVREALAEAVDGLISMRVAEGRKLGAALEGHLDAVASLRQVVRDRIPVAVGERQDRLRKKVDELLADRGVDESRMLQELVLLAERADVTEELERLESHIGQFRKLLVSEDAVGRKMDFLIQEMNREANTVGSKCNDATVAHLVVDLKAELERMREQVQNVE